MKTNLHSLCTFALIKEGDSAEGGRWEQKETNMVLNAHHEALGDTVTNQLAGMTHLPKFSG